MDNYIVVMEKLIGVFIGLSISVTLTEFVVVKAIESYRRVREVIDSREEEPRG